MNGKGIIIISSIMMIVGIIGTVAGSGLFAGLLALGFVGFIMGRLKQD